MDPNTLYNWLTDNPIGKNIDYRVLSKHMQDPTRTCTNAVNDITNIYSWLQIELNDPILKISSAETDQGDGLALPAVELKCNCANTTSFGSIVVSPRFTGCILAVVNNLPKNNIVAHVSQDSSNRDNNHGLQLRRLTNSFASNPNQVKIFDSVGQLPEGAKEAYVIGVLHSLDWVYFYIATKRGIGDFYDTILDCRQISFSPLPALAPA